MAIDATGTPTSLGIPKFNTAVDAPSGKGGNAQMDAIDTLIAALPQKPTGIVTGETIIFNTATGLWDRSSVTKLGYSSFVRPGANLTAAGAITITDTIHVLTAGSGATVSNINGGFSGAVVTLINRTGGNVTFNSAGNIFATPAAGSVVIADKSSIELAWDHNNAVWIVVAGAPIPSFIGVEKDYAEITANATSVATTAATATAAITGASVAYNGTDVILIEFEAVSATHTAPNAIMAWNLYDGVTDLGIICQSWETTTGTGNMHVRGSRRLTPSNGAHQYSIRAWSNTAGTVTTVAGTGGAGVVLPAYMRITRVA